MKYSILLLLTLSLILTGCFAKKDINENTDIPISDVVENNITDTQKESEDIIGNTIEDILDEKTGNNDENINTNTSTGTSGITQDSIEEYDAELQELEALFDDLLGSEK